MVNEGKTRFRICGKQVFEFILKKYPMHRDVFEKVLKEKSCTAAETHLAWDLMEKHLKDNKQQKYKEIEGIFFREDFLRMPKGHVITIRKNGGFVAYD